MHQAYYIPVKFTSVSYQNQIHIIPLTTSDKKSISYVVFELSLYEVMINRKRVFSRQLIPNIDGIDKLG